MSIPLIQIPIILARYKYLMLFPAVAIEGPIITIIAGFLAGQSLINIYLAYAVIVAGDLAGDVFYYTLGRWGRIGLINKMGGLFGFSAERIKKLEKHFTNHGGKTILIGKLAHGIGTVFLAAAGASKMPVKKFIYYNFIGTVPKSLILLLIGYFFGQAYVRINAYLDYYALAVLILPLLLIIIYLLIIKIIRKKSRDDY